MTGQYCLSCVDVFCGSFNGFIFSANLVPVMTGDVDGDGYVDVLDLIDVLLCFGLPAAGGCESEDINGDGNVNVLDLIEVLRAFGVSRP